MNIYYSSGVISTRNRAWTAEWVVWSSEYVAESDCHAQTPCLDLSRSAGVTCSRCGIPIAFGWLPSANASDNFPMDLWKMRKLIGKTCDYSVIFILSIFIPQFTRQHENSLTQTSTHSPPIAIPKQ